MWNLRKSARSMQSEPPLERRDLFTRLVRARPLFTAALFFLLGCILGRAAWLPMMTWILLLALILLPCAALRRGRIIPVLLVLAMLPLGALRFGMQWRSLDPLPEQKGAALSGRICEIPQLQEDRQRCICVIEDLRVDANPVPGKLRLYLRSEGADENLLRAPQLGQRVFCTARLWRGDPATNPGQFDFDAYLRLHGLRGYATASVETARFEDAPYTLADRRQLLRTSIGARIDRLFPQNSAIARAFLLGDRSGLSEEERRSYSDSGAAHLLAISGMHISILAGALTLLLRRFLSRRRSFLAVLALLIAYGALIGFGPSLTRAILMYAVFGAAPLLCRYSDAPTRLAAALLLQLLIRPIAILDVGFILSYGASAGILLLTPPLARLLRAEGLLGGKPGRGPSALPRWIAGMVLTSLAAQLAILPAVIHAFGAQPLFTLVVNLLAMPLAMAAYILAIAGTILGLMPIARIADLAFGLLTACVRFFGNLPISTLRIARFPWWLTLLCAAACLLASDLSKLPARLRKYLPLAVILAALISNGCARLTTLGCSIVFLDAGQADCAVIRTEGKVYLIDAGDAYSPAADYLSAMNYDLEAVFLSHPHADHAAGLREVLEVCVPRRIYLSPHWDRFDVDASVAEAVDAAVAMGAELVEVSAGDKIALSGKTSLEVLSPAAGFSPDSANDDSLILRVTYGACSAVFTGDAGASVAAGLVPDSDVLKVAHHGGADSLSARLLTEVSPSAAIIPVGENNYGHPAEETLKLLAAADAKTFRTDACGAITCRMRADGRATLSTTLNLEDANALE